MRSVLFTLGCLLVGFAALAGDPDSDGDGYVDSADPCPTQPETLSRFAVADGCPDNATTPPRRTDPRGGNDPTMLLGVIYFGKNSAAVEGEDGRVLEQAARRVLSSPTGGSVALIGHADPTEGGDRSALSRERCEAVRTALGAAGVPASRLGFCFGAADRVLATATGDARLNQRVEIAVKQSVIGNYTGGFGDE